MKNYYQILNVAQNATEMDIKRSYRVLAKKYHPDVNPGDSAAAGKFADINEANEVLSDPKARAEYDQKLKESMQPRQNPEDIIARQRQQAQAAARAAARAAQEQAFRTRAAQQSAQFAANPAFQAQVQAIRNQAYQTGYEKGIGDARAEAATEISKLNAKIRTLTRENSSFKTKADSEDSLKRRLAEAERDRSELEQELFHRDRELSQEKIRAREMEDQLLALRSDTNTKNMSARKMSKELDELRAQLDAEVQNVRRLEAENKRLEQEKAQADMRNQAQIDLQHEKRRQIQEELDELRKKLADAEADNEALRDENAQWQQYAKSEQFLSDTERRIEEWEKKVKADRRLAKPTLYGALGVLIWSTPEEITSAYKKLSRRYSGKTDEAVVAKLAKVEEAYAVVGDPQKRADYDKTIGITEERIAEERKLIAENESLMEEYQKRIAGKEFWERFEELTADAMEGDPVAQNTLGEMYYYGDEIDRDLEQAVFWFKEGAKQKHPDAMYNLGVCFVNGEGVEKNEATGRGFIRQAVKMGARSGK